MAKFQTVDIGKTASAATIIFNAIRKAIIEGELIEGEPLRQDEIARMFNTSRIPVREAITMLEQQGLVQTERYRGAVVAGLSIQEASEIFDFRILLEAEVIRHAVPNMTRAALDEAGTCLAELDRVEDPMDYGDLNRRFHAILYGASNLTYHLGVIDNSMDRIDRYLRAQMLLSGGMARSNQEHLAILDACQRGDAKAAAELTADHIRSAKLSLEEHMAPRAGQPTQSG